MNQKAGKLLRGCVAILLLRETICQGNKFNCKVFVENDILQANCNGISKLNGVPQDIDTKIKKLDLSDNTLSNISETQFNRYPDLEILTMLNVNASFNKSYYYLFRPLKKLRTLHLDYGTWNWISPTVGDMVFYWPPSLKNLTVRFSSVWFLDLSNLKQLEYLDARENELQMFPIFHKLAPLKHLNLSLTHLARMRAENLAPLCLLKQVHVVLVSTQNVHPAILYPEKYCECQRLHAWANQTGIKGILPKCSSSRGETCDMSFSEDMLSIRKACLSRKSKSYLFIILIVVFIVAIIAGAGAGGYYYWMKKKSKTSDSSSVD